MKKIIIPVVAAMLAITGCSGANNGNNTANKTEGNGEAPVYCFVGGILAGSWENGQWVSHNDVDGNMDENSGHQYKIGEVLSVDGYNMWYNEELEGKGDTLIYYGGYGNDGMDNFSTEGEDGSRSIKMPVDKDSALAQLDFPQYAFYSRFSYDNDNFDNVSVSTDKNIAPENVNTKAKPSEASKNAIKEYLEKNGITTAPNLTQCFEADFDGDGKLEQIVAANTPKNENYVPSFVEDGTKETDGIGSYAVALFVDDDGSAKPVFSEIRPFEGEENAYMHYNQNIVINGVYDINGDGNYDVCIVYADWENGHVLVSAMDEKGDYQTVLRGNFGA